MNRKMQTKWLNMLSGAVMLAALVAVGPAVAEDRYYDTSNSTGLQGGGSLFTNVVWASNTDGTGQGTLMVASNDNVFIQVDTSKSVRINWQVPGTFYINNWTVDNGNIVSNNPSGGLLNLRGTLTVQGNSYMYWGAGASFKFITTPNNNLTIQGGSTNIFSSGGAGGYTFSNLLFGTGNNLLGLLGSGTFTFSNISGGSSSRISVDSFATLKIDNPADCSFDGVIAGDGKVAKNGAGTLTLSGANSYANTTTLSAGTLVVSNQLALQQSTFEKSGGNLRFGDGISEFTFGGLSGNGNFGLTNYSGAITLKVGANDDNTSYTGAMSGSGSLIKVGSGTLTTTANQLYTGSTTIQSGTFDFQSRLSSGDYYNVITNNGTLVWEAGNDQTLRGVISGIGTLIKKTASTLSLLGVNTYSGATIVSNGILKVANTGSLSTNTALTVVGTNSVVNMNGKAQSCISVGGSGFVTNGTLNVTSALYPGGSNTVGTLTLGNLTLATGTTVHWDYDTGASDTNKVLGTATLPASATVQVNASGTLPSRAVLFDCYSLVAPSGVAGWTVKGALPNSFVKVEGTQLLLINIKGTMISFY